MMSQREVERKYAALMKDVQTNDFYTQVDLTNRVNCYICTRCKHITKTRDIDSGVTPFIYSCEACGGEAHSTMYRDVAPSQVPTIEWYRPGLDEVMKMRSKRFNDIEHILKGGLMDRKIKPQIPEKTPDQPGYKYAQLQKEPTKEDILEYLKKTPQVITRVPDVDVNAIIDFATWYSGMERTKVARAYERYLKEVVNRKPEL